MPEDQIFDVQTRAEMPVEIQPPNPGWKRFWNQYKVIIISVFAALLILGIVGFFLMGNGDGPEQVSQNVLLTIKGPSQTTSGNEAEYTVTYINGENADLVGVSLEMIYPTGFKYKSATPSPSSTTGTIFNLPILKQGETGNVVIRGKLSGGTGEDKELRARLHYRLSNFNSEFIVTESTKTSIQAPNLLLDINGPVDVVNGQDTTFNITVTNVSSQNFDNVGLELSYPPGFTFVSSNVQPSTSNNYWKLGPLASTNSQSIEITGSFTGGDREEKLVRADLGEIINNNFAPQIVSTASFRLIPSSLALTITASQPTYVMLGSNISYKLQYANRGSIGLKNLIVTAKIESPVVDLSRINASNAIITGNILTWKTATLSNLGVLSPSEKGEISFSLPIKNSLTTNLKNQMVKVSASISSDEITNPTRAADYELKLISDLDLSVSGEYISGASPMQVGETTVYEITLLLSNLSNDISNGEVIASIPLPPSAWNNVIMPDQEKSRLSYDPNSGKIRWKIGDIPAFVGKFTPATQVTFQLAVTPSENSKGKDIVLVRDVQAFGTDSFVNVDIKSEITKSFTTSNIDDVLGGGRVQ